jgi:ribosome maturation factor RimP
VSVAERVAAIVEPLLAPRHLELVDVEFASGHLRITVDEPGGVGLDTLGQVTKQISRALDVHDPVPGRYTLEVSSPGLERRLRTAPHFSRAVGETIAVRTQPGIEPRRITGTLIAADDDGFTVRTADAAEPERRLGYDEVERARTVFEWGGPAPKPGSQQTRPKKKKKAAPR